MTNLIEDVSALTEVTEATLEKLLKVSTHCIGHAVHESICEKQEITKIDLGIGELTIRVSTEGIQYRFVPSTSLEKLLVQTVTSKTSPMVIQIENKLQDKINKTYKEVL